MKKSAVTLSDADRSRGEALRDRYLAARAGQSSDEERAKLFADLEAADAPAVQQVDGLSVSFCPTARFKTLRFLDEGLIKPAFRGLFARPSAQAPKLVAAFVDPEELHFRAFENIVPLDRLFESAKLRLSLGRGKPIDKGQSALVFAVEATEATKRALSMPDALGLYAPPLNPGSRGGQRLVFHSARLSEVLTEAVKKSLPKPRLKGFSHVNPVFRCNRFEPGDTKFRSHYDTPYYDASRSHVSRQTLLLYLTGGKGAPALRIEDAALDSIAEMTCVIFDQDREHEATAYVDGPKVFLRTELIFEDASVEHDPRIAQLFSRACYLTGDSLGSDEIAAFTHDCYDRVAAAHWKGLSDKPANAVEPFVHRTFRGAHFVSNGYDFWFPKGALSLAECSALTVLDYFNCKVGGASFRKLCASKVVRGKRDASWVPSFLAKHSAPLPEPLFAALDKDALFPAPESPSKEQCCPFHYADYFDASVQGEMIGMYEEAQEYAKQGILPAPILMLGEEVFLDPGKFVVQGGSIHVLSDKAIAPVNFAACWNDESSPSNYIGVEATLEAPHLLVPPILFTEVDGCYHLMLDFFRNSWMVAHNPRAVPVPRIEPQYAYDDTTPWVSALPEEDREAFE
jgi:hypothetical protein